MSAQVAHEGADEKKKLMDFTRIWYEIFPAAQDSSIAAELRRSVRVRLVGQKKLSRAGAGDDLARRSLAALSEFRNRTTCRDCSAMDFGAACRL